MRHISLASGVVLACLYLVVPADAAIIYQLTDAAGLEQTSFVIGGIGQTVDIGVWLKQTDPDTVLTDEGVFSVGVKLAYGGTGTAEVLLESDITPNPAFDDPTGLFKEIAADYIALDMAVSDPSMPVFPQATTPDRIWLGMLRFTGLSVGTVEITAMDYPGVDNTVSGLGTVLDPEIASGQGSISVVPEPNTMVLFAGFALVGGPYWLVRRGSLHGQRRHR